MRRQENVERMYLLLCIWVTVTVAFFAQQLDYRATNDKLIDLRMFTWTISYFVSFDFNTFCTRNVCMSFYDLIIVVPSVRARPRASANISRRADCDLLMASVKWQERAALLVIVRERERKWAAPLVVDFSTSLLLTDQAPA